MSIVEQKVRSMIAVPSADQRPRHRADLSSIQPHLVREFTREDLNLLTVMANVAAIRIEHARLNEIEEAERAMAKDMQQAALIQQRLLPEQIARRRPDWTSPDKPQPAAPSAAIITISSPSPTAASACWSATSPAKACPPAC